MTVDQQPLKEAFPWQNADSWGDMTAHMPEVLRTTSSSEAEYAAQALTRMTRWERKRTFTEDIPDASDVVYLSSKELSYLERQVGEVSGAIRRQIIARNDLEGCARTTVRLFPEEAEFLSELLKVRGYEVTWLEAPERLPHPVDHSDGRTDRTIVVRIQDNWL